MHINLILKVLKIIIISAESWYYGESSGRLWKQLEYAMSVYTCAKYMLFMVIIHIRYQSWSSSLNCVFLLFSPHFPISTPSASFFPLHIRTDGYNSCSIFENFWDPDLAWEFAIFIKVLYGSYQSLQDIIQIIL